MTMDELLERLVTAAERAVELLEDIHCTLREVAVDADNTGRIVDEIGSKLPWIEP